MKSSFGWITYFATVGPVTLCLAETSRSSSSAPTARFASSSSKSRTFGVVLSALKHKNSPVTTAMDCIMDLRGGASKRLSTSSKTPPGRNKVSGSTKKAKAIRIVDIMPTFTKHYLYAILFISLIGTVIGKERANAAFSLDPIRLFFGFEIWRPFTAACFLGAPSMQCLVSIYHLFYYVSTLERAYGGAQFLVFMASQIFILVLLATLLGQPFLLQAAVTGMLYVVSRLTTKENVPWILPRYRAGHYLMPMLPPTFSRPDAVGALIPHIMGILAGHLYYYEKVMRPATKGGEDWLLAPRFIVEFVDGKEASMNAVNNDLKTTKRKSRDRTLGSAIAA